jgi:hypothetical protein
MRFCVVALCLGTAVAAKTPMAVSDFVGMVTSALAVDRDDERIANALESVRLSECLSDSTIGMLRRMGAGPATVRQLQALARKSRALPSPPQEPIGITPEPSASEREAMLDAMLRYASGYLASLPDFICTREARQFRADVNAAGLPTSLPWSNRGGSGAAYPFNHWNAVGSYTVEAAYAGGADHYKLTLVDGRPAKRSFDELRQKVSVGEFAGGLKEVFASGANFEWDRWEVTGGKRPALFAYYADLAHSTYWLCCPALKTAHRGFVYADPESGAVRRIIINAADLPKGSQITGTALVLDYGEVTVGDRGYLLPRSSAACSRTRALESREDIDYRNYRKYRKFGADATVAFPSADQPQP